MAVFTGTTPDYILERGSAGIYGKRFNGYFADNLAFFATAVPHGDISQTNQLNNFTSAADTYTWMWVGLFYAQVSCTYSFSTNSDDASYLWLGANAIKGTTVQNALINNGGLHGPRTITNSIVLEANTIYPLKIIFGEQAGGDFITVSFIAPNSTSTTDGTGFYYYGLELWNTVINL